MRYYNITVGGTNWCSVINGQNDPGALDIELDITDAPNGQVITGWLKIYGIPQDLIKQAVNFSFQPITIFAGMTEGLPLANRQVPHQGQLVSGTVLSTLGNWIGNELSIEFIIRPGGNVGGPTAPKNLVHNMPAGTPLSAAIQNTLTTAFPGIKVNVNISPNLVLTYPDQGFHSGLEQYQNYVKQLSHDILGTPQTTGYKGVQIDTSKNNEFNVFDGTVLAGAITLQFDDLIGQPTWVDSYEIQIKTVLRGDIVTANSSGNLQVTLPQGILVTSTPNAYQMFVPGQAILSSQPGDILNFQGTYIVKSVRHIGRFRQPTGEAWVSVITATPNLPNAGILANSSGQQTFNGSGGIGHQ